VNSTPVSSILLVLFGSFIGSFGAVFLKLGAMRLTGRTLDFLNWQLAAGVVLYLGSSVPFVMGIKHGELSVLYPMVSAGYVCTMIWSRLFFNEPITKAKVGALGMILLGLVCLTSLGRG